MKMCFVCLGNICRSPTAEGVMRHLLEREGLAHTVESAGTADYHVGELPDCRTIATAARRGVTLSSRARHFTAEHLDQYDVVFAMDRSHLRHLQRLCGDRPVRAKLHLLREFDAQARGDLDVPDPYYEGSAVFEQVFDICLRACSEVVAKLKTGAWP